jgi:hypothetical protein
MTLSEYAFALSNVIYVALNIAPKQSLHPDLSICSRLQAAPIIAIL